MRSVCIIRSNPVRPDSRVEKEAWTLIKAGYDVHILAWDRSSSEYECNDNINVGGISIPITRLGHKATFGDGFKNIKPYLAFQIHMRKWLKKHKFNIIHACDFDTAFFSRDVVKRQKGKFVFDIFDFLHGDPKNLFQRIIRHAQIKLINEADATIICTEERKLQIVGSEPKKLTVIHNTPSNIHIQTNTINIPKTNRTKIVYVGILQDFRLLKEIGEAVAESSSIELHIAGFGKYEEHFTNLSAKYANIYFYGCLSYEQTLSLERQCDIMLGIYDPCIENHRFAAPNKFYESLMLGKPIVMVRSTGMSNIVEKHDIGVLINYTKSSFVEGIHHLISKKDKWHLMSEKMRLLYNEKYSWEEMDKRLVNLYNSL